MERCRSMPLAAVPAVVGWGLESRGLWRQSLCLLSADRCASRLVMSELTGSPFLCSGADEDEDTWRPARRPPRWNTPPSPCAYVTACVQRLLTPVKAPRQATCFRQMPPQTRSRRRALQGMTSFTATDPCFSFSCGRKRKSAPVLHQEQLQGPQVIPSTAALNFLRKASPCNGVYPNSITSLRRSWNHREGQPGFVSLPANHPPLYSYRSME